MGLVVLALLGLLSIIMVARWANEAQKRRRDEHGSD